jgi:hypothetical protein
VKRNLHKHPNLFRNGTNSKKKKKDNKKTIRILLTEMENPRHFERDRIFFYRFLSPIFPFLFTFFCSTPLKKMGFNYNFYARTQSLHPGSLLLSFRRLIDHRLFFSFFSSSVLPPSSGEIGAKNNHSSPSVERFLLKTGSPHLPRQ